MFPASHLGLDKALHVLERVEPGTPGVQVFRQVRFL